MFMDMTYEAVTARLAAKGYIMHHAASCSRYTSRTRKDVEFDVYKGMFGEGYRIYRPYYNTTRYSRCEYWIKYQ